MQIEIELIGDTHEIEKIKKFIADKLYFSNNIGYKYTRLENGLESTSHRELNHLPREDYP